MIPDVTAPFQLWHAAVLGMVQGLTEFLPISSTAHLALIPWFFRWSDPGLAFDVALHIGTLLAVVIYFWSDLQRLFLSLLPARGEVDEAQVLGRRQVLALVVGTLPAVVAGVLLEKPVSTYLRAPIVMAGTLAGVALLMSWAEWRGQGPRPWEGITLLDAFFIGLAQACALIPGVSRSGATITAGMFLGLGREAAARFSFLLGFPAIAGSAVFEARHLTGLLTAPDELRLLIIGILISFLSGYAAIAWLLRFLQTRTLWVFIVYRLILGVVILELLPEVTIH